MDFGMSVFNNTSMLSHEQKTNGSEFTKQDNRSDPDLQPPDDQNQQQHYFFPTSKSLKTDYFDQPNKTTMPIRSDSLLSVSAPDANNMLSFSSSTDSTKDENHTSLFSFYQPSPAYSRNTGYGYGGIQTSIPVSRYKGPFTPSQWMELEHQALIYKHFVANVPVPSNLLNPLRKSLNTFLLPGSSFSASYSPSSYGWGTFRLGFSGNTDPEPGRCRRTDGKKWRCSRDAVPDQKYCERHINRGRHRSRKPVESQNGHAVSGPTTPKVGQPVPISSTRVFTTPLSAATPIPSSRGQESHAFGIDMLSLPKQQNSIKESTESLMCATNYNSFMDQGACNLNLVPGFVNEWSNDSSIKPDWTQLSMSNPMASDFSSSSNSPAQEKLADAPLGLTSEFDLDLDPNHKQVSNWIPISWGNSMGGPLGEVLNQTSSNSGVRVKNASFGSEINQQTETWDAVNYQTGSSPTGVLQKTPFVSLSSSSSGSSPKGDKKCDELLLSTLAS
ncbi:growth-regulating factor 2-like [Rutidosis leptorrhynchoides]|uniref:growth-regulating factor 2-like n=1 Tax=Rutidosis leptorrhynchoides TaxID=125765 RepID=UPI003A9A27AE